MLFKPEHIPPILRGSKTQTRRLWTRWMVKEGGLYPAQTRLFEPLSRFAKIKCLRRWEEELGAISLEDALAEGARDVEHYFQIFRQINGDVPLDTVVRAIEFEVVEVVPCDTTLRYQRRAGVPDVLLSDIMDAWHDSYEVVTVETVEAEVLYHSLGPGIIRTGYQKVVPRRKPYER